MRVCPRVVFNWLCLVVFIVCITEISAVDPGVSNNPGEGGAVGCGEGAGESRFGIGDRIELLNPVGFKNELACGVGGERLIKAALDMPSLLILSGRLSWSCKLVIGNESSSSSSSRTFFSRAKRSQ